MINDTGGAGSDSDRSRNAVRPFGGPQEVGLTRS